MTVISGLPHQLAGRMKRTPLRHGNPLATGRRTRRLQIPHREGQGEPESGLFHQRSLPGAGPAWSWFYRHLPRVSAHAPDLPTQGLGTSSPCASRFLFDPLMTSGAASSLLLASQSVSRPLLDLSNFWSDAHPGTVYAIDDPRHGRLNPPALAPGRSRGEGRTKTMAVTVGLAEVASMSRILPPQFGTAANTPSQVDTMSLFPTSPGDFLSRVDGLISSARVTVVTTVQTVQTVQVVETYQTTITQPLTVFVTQTATVQETLRETVQVPAQTPLPQPPPPPQQQVPQMPLPPPPQVPPPQAQPQAPGQMAGPAASQVRPDGPVTTESNPGADATPPAMMDPTAEPATLPGIPPAQAGANAGPGGPPPVKDPAAAMFFGGVPTKTLDLPITAVFLVLFALGGFLHISIYKRNAKRGHKFLLSDLMFDFCMIRVVTCIFRITWSIVSTRGVILVALITLNGG